MYTLRTAVLLAVVIVGNAYSNEMNSSRNYPYVISEGYRLSDDSRIGVELGAKLATNENLAEGLVQTANLAEKAAEKTTLAQNGKFDETMKMLSDSAENATGDEAEFYKISRDYFHEVKLANDRWNQSFDAVQAPRILDYSVLTSDEEFEYQKGVVKKYIDESIAAKERSDNWVLNYEKRLSVLGEDNDFAKGAIKGASESWAARQKVANPLIEAHIKYGNSLLEVLELLQGNKGDWSYENNQLQFSKDDTRSSYNALSHSINGNAAIINSLSRVANPGM